MRPHTFYISEMYEFKKILTRMIASKTMSKVGLYDTPHHCTYLVELAVKNDYVGLVIRMSFCGDHETEILFYLVSVCLLQTNTQ